MTLKIGIYKITSPTGRIYIGQSRDIDRRFATYKRLACKDQPKLYNSFLKHGVDNHSFEVLEECGEYKLNALETYYILLYKTNESNHLNCRIDGIINRHSEESKNKIRQKLKGNKNTLGFKQRPESIQKAVQNRKSRKGLKTKPMSDKNKKLLSERMKGNTYGYNRKHTEKFKKAASLRMMGNKNTLGLKMSDKNKEALRERNIGRRMGEDSKTKISAANKGRVRDEEMRKRMSEGKKGKVYIYFKPVLNLQTGIFYDSISEAALTSNIKETYLGRMLRGERKNKTSFILI